MKYKKHKKESKKIVTNKMCQYGCGSVGQYLLSNNKVCCTKSYNSCKKIREKNSIGIKLLHKLGRAYEFTSENRKWWKKKTKKEIKLIREKQGNNYKENSRLGLHKPNAGFKNIKWFKIWCPFLKMFVLVQGTWEYNYAMFLTKNKINWARSNIYALKYWKNKEQKYHYYFPDFYLPDTNEYIEIKGEWIVHGKDSKEKLSLVKKCNKKIKLTVLDYYKLKKLGIIYSAKAEVLESADKAALKAAGT